MKKLHNGFLLALLFSTISCSKFLDLKPIDSIAPANYYNNELELNRALAGVYDRLGDLRLYARGMFCWMVFSDEFFMKGVTSGASSNTWDASTLELNRSWEAIYTGIGRANMLLDNIGNAKEVKEEVIDEIRGQALFLRGYFYFMLADMWGGVPLKTEAIKSPNEPFLPKTPLADVYAQIVRDMKEAEELVKDISDYGYNGRITKTAVQGVLARVFLTMAGSPLNDVSKYEDAREYAMRVIKSGEHELNPDYKQVFINHSQDRYDIKECLWEIEFSGDNEGLIREGGSVGSYIGIANSNIETGFGYDLVHATAKLYNTYEDQDLRRDWSIAPFRYVVTGGVAVKTDWLTTQIYERSAGKWRREYELLRPMNKDFNGTNFPILRYSDVLLMFAEAENHVNGATTEAYDALNQVRRRGYGKPVDVPDAVADAPAGMSDVDFLEFLKNERMRELSFEGLRKHDLIRWGMYVPVMQQMVQEYQATAPAALLNAMVIQARNVTERSVLFPVPASEIAVNPYIVQNKGW